MNEHRYILEKYNGMKTRYRCPSCQHRDKTFSRYIDTQTGEHLHASVGRCNREINCGYHYTPKQYFSDNKFLFVPQPKHNTKPKQAVKPASFVPVEALEKSLQAHTENNFVKFLFGLFGEEITTGLLEKYFIGTSKQWQGATVFFQIDISGNVRTGKIMLYNSDTGKRYKDKFHWAHKLLNIENFNLKQCFFGEHLLQDKTKPVAIFESEKTAAIASVYFPEMICIACGSLQGLSPEKCKVLQGRTVLLYPDLSKPKLGNLSAFELWSAKAKELSRLFPRTWFAVPDLLERSAAEIEREQGLDLADFLIRYDYRDFQQSGQPEATQSALEQPQQAVIETMQEISICTKDFSEVIEQPENWTDEITELGTYFKTATLPTDSVRMNQFSTITDVCLFVHSHLSIVQANNGNKTFLPYLDRLKELKQYLNGNEN